MSGALSRLIPGKAPLTGQPFRVMVVDDSAVIRGFIARWLEEDPEITVVSTASNGQIAVKAVASADAEVVILDIEMPVMDGLTALPKLIEEVPDIKVIMASTLTLRNADISIKAMALGASDYVPKPESTREVNASEDFKRDITSKVKALAAARRRARNEMLPSDRRYGAVAAKSVVSKSPMSAPFGGRAPAGATIELVKPSPVMPRILGVGSSTGGPQALTKFLGDIARLTRIPILVTQHMPPTFTSIMAEHIHKATGLPCAEAVDGERLVGGQIYVAPGDYHMTVVSNGVNKVIRLDQGAQEHFCRPSVNPMFRSIAKEYGRAALCTVLTGMGADGVEGSHEVVRVGGTLIAQDEATSVVWGMPGAVAMAGICSAVLPVHDLGSEAINLMTGGAK